MAWSCCWGLNGGRNKKSVTSCSLLIELLFIFLLLRGDDEADLFIIIVVDHNRSLFYLQRHEIFIGMVNSHWRFEMTTAFATAFCILP